MRILTSASAFLVALLAAAAAYALEPPLPMNEAFRLEATRDGTDIALRWRLEDGYYLYREHLTAIGPDGTPLKLSTQPGVIKQDPGFGSTEVYYGSATATISAPASGNVKLTYQGCQDRGLCYPPTTVKIGPDGQIHETARANEGGFKTASPIATKARPLVSKAAASFKDGSAVRISEQPAQGEVGSLFERGGLPLLIAGFVGFGILLAFTPCVFPMYPILAATLSREGERLSARRGFAVSLTYVISLATAFSLFGIVAAWWGQSFQAALQSVPAMLVVAAVFVALALSSFGLFELQLPAFLRNRLTPHRRRSGSLASSAVLGFSSALVIGPCVTAPLAGALLYIAQTGNVVLGAAALFALGVGKGIPLILMGTFGSGLLPRAGQWMGRIRQVFGFLFLATAVWFLDRVLPAGTGLLLWSALAIAFAVFVGAFDYMTPERGVAARLAKSIGIFSGIYGTLLAVGGLLGATDPLNPLAPIVAGHSAPSSRSEVISKDSFHSVASAADLSSLMKSGAKDTPSLVYFTADWCVTCRVIERSVLPEAGVAQALDGVRLISVDLSKITDASRSLMKDLQVVGPPTMLFLNGSNKELPGSRLVGEIDAVSIVASSSAAKEALR